MTLGWCKVGLLRNVKTYLHDNLAWDSTMIKWFSWVYWELLRLHLTVHSLLWLRMIQGSPPTPNRKIYQMLTWPVKLFGWILVDPVLDLKWLVLRRDFSCEHLYFVYLLLIVTLTETSALTELKAVILLRWVGFLYVKLRFKFYFRLRSMYFLGWGLYYFSRIRSWF